MNRHMLMALITGAALQLAATTGCYWLSPSHGGGQTTAKSHNQPQPGDVVVPPGYRITLLTDGLTYPTGIAFDDQRTPYVVESGYSWGESFTVPRLLRLTDHGPEIITHGVQDRDGPWTGIAYARGRFFIADGGVKAGGGRVLSISPTGEQRTLADHLPSVGDHHVNGPAVSRDGHVYFAIGTATNSGVVGVDSAQYGWLPRHPDFCDIPAKDILLTGANFESPDPLHPGNTAITGAFVPFGTQTQPGQRIPGRLPCTGAVLRVPSEGGPLELVAWGLRNPFGLTFRTDGTLFVTENAFDVRGSRPVWGTGDTLWAIDPHRDLGKWYGWPDYFDGQPLNTPKRFTPPGKETPKLLLAEKPNDPPRPAAIFGVHASANGLDVAPDSFGHAGDLFVAEFGDMAPEVGRVMSPVGFCVVRVNPQNGVIEPFAINRSPTGENAPASKLGTAGLERPVSVKFGPDGALYVVDFGVMTMSEKGPHPQPGTGKIWRIEREAGQ